MIPLSHFREFERYKLENRDLGPLDAIRMILNASRREFIAHSFGTALREDNTAVTVHIASMGHDNIPRILTETLTTRFNLEIERDGRDIIIPVSELDPLTNYGGGTSEVADD